MFLEVYSHTNISVSLFLTHLYRTVNDFRNYVCLHLDLDIVQCIAEVTFVLPKGVHAMSSTEGTVIRQQLTASADTTNTQVLCVGLCESMSIYIYIGQGNKTCSQNMSFGIL